MRRALSYSQMPPLSVPLRFLLSAPLMAVLACLLLLAHPAALLASRWSGEALAGTHLLTLGFLSMCMLGALLQILPVVSGVVVPRPQLVGAVTHSTLVAGTLLLVAAFLLQAPLLFKLALPLLALAFLVFLIAAGIGLAGNIADGASASTAAIRYAILAVLVTVVLGVLLGFAFAGWLPSLPLLELVELHLAWGWGGWIGLLVMGVAFQVIPMFQATPLYPERYARLAPGLLLLLLLALSLRALLPPWTVLALDATAMLCLGSFAVLSLRLLRQRKRPRADATTLYWRLALVSLLAALAAGLATRAGLPLGLLAGMLFLLGFACSAVTGMLVKIVPFLAWYHLQDRAGLLEGKKPPGLSAFLPEAGARQQFWLYLPGLLLVSLACFLQSLAMSATAVLLARLGAAMLAASFLWLWWKLLGAARLYRRELQLVQAAA